jgi:hypothetical protein
MRRERATLLALLLLAACATEQRVMERVEATRSGPKAKPTRNITGFASSLRCMDQLMIDFGVPTLAVMMEDLTDQTGSVKAGTRDMLIAAVSDMTRRSRAVRVNAFGNDSGNLVSYISAAGRQSVYQGIPPYDIRGSISQLDEGLVREQVDAGVAFDDDLGTGVSKSAGASILGLDLSVISTQDLSVVAGVSSRNSIVIMQSGHAVDADATISKGGVNFSLMLSESEGKAQALRTLIELATVELFGRLHKLPYWTCLGIEDSHAEIEAEIEDWFYSMSGHGELEPWVADQLRLLGYAGEDGELEEAIASYRRAAGLSDGSQLDAGLFRALLERRAPARAPAQARAPLADARAIRIQVGSDALAPGDRLELRIQTESSGYLYCFYTDEDRQVLRFYPNRFGAGGYVSADAVVEIPGSMPFEITASARGAAEAVNCFLTARDVLPELPDPIRTADFEGLAGVSIAEVREGLRRVAGPQLAEGELVIRTR